jgi:hypothetical protein
MKQNLNKISLCFLTISAVVACTPQTPPPPTVDSISTIAMQLASQMLTETVAAYSPTPPPATETPAPTATETPPPTAVVTNIPEVVGSSPCYTGPGDTYPLTSNISDTKKVEIVGVGNVPGWYIINNPYFGSTCWISAEHLKLDPNSDFSGLPVISP